MSSFFLVFDSGFGVLSSVCFDAIISESHVGAATVTEHAVEEGAPITDYVRPHNMRISVEGYVTNTPLATQEPAGLAPSVGFLRYAPTPMILSGRGKHWVASAQVSGGGASFPLQTNGIPRPHLPVKATAAATAQITRTVTGNSIQYPVYVDRVSEVYDALESCRARGAEIRIVSDILNHESVYLTSLSRAREAADGASLVMEFVSVRFVSSKAVTVKTKVPEEKRAAVVPPASDKAPAPLSSLADTGAEANDTSSLEREGLQWAAPVLQSLIE